MVEMEEKIKKIAEEAGAGKIGFAKTDFKKEDRLFKYKSSITLIFPLLEGIISSIENKPTYEYFHHYRSINRLIDDTTLKISMYIEKKGYLAYPVAASQSVKGDYCGIFSHKQGATSSGLGWIGKSALLVTSEYGPRVRLGTILTDIDFINYGEKINKSKCNECNICRDKCPALAITGKNWELGMERAEIFDAKACSEHMKNAYKDIGRGAVCGICIACCPYSRIKK